MKASSKTPALLSLTALALVSVATGPVSARNNIEITDGKGEAVVVKQGLFGNNTYAVQDRLGNQVVTKKGIFGNKAQGVSILGNTVETKRGIFGSRSYSGTSILGDHIETKRSWFGLGPRTTKVDVSGVSGLASQLIKKRSTPAATVSRPDASVSANQTLDQNQELPATDNQSIQP